MLWARLGHKNQSALADLVASKIVPDKYPELRTQNRMSLFNFQLHPIAEVAPFGQPPHLHLHWFGLTDGWYWIDTGSEELFRYTSVILQHWQRNSPELRSFSNLDYYPDYYVVRLWEDILDLLPNVLEPIPAPLAALLTSETEWDALYDRFVRKLESENDEETIDVYLDAMSWWRARRLSTSHLRSGPHIWFWSDGVDLFIDWDN